MTKDPRLIAPRTRPDPAMPARLTRILALTRLGLVAEAVVRAFWPLWSVLALGLGTVLLGGIDRIGDHGLLALVAGWGLALLATLVIGLRRMRWPGHADAVARLDATLPGRPLQALADEQAVGATDPASAAVWAAHRARMAARAATARAPEPDLRVARLDPYALRYMALLVLGTGLVFGSVGRVHSIPGLGTPGAAVATGPTWEGWIEPPAYTGLPTLYLADQAGDQLVLSQGSRVTLRLYGPEGALSVRETVSDRPLDTNATATAQDFAVVRSGALDISGPGGRVWDVALRPDALPTIALEGDIETEFTGQSRIPFRAEDDHGVVAGTATLSLVLEAVDRRYGRSRAPDPRPALSIPLPLPIAGDRAAFTEALVDDFSQHPWAHLPVEIVLRAEDAAGQFGGGSSSGDNAGGGPSSSDDRRGRTSRDGV
ncbi:MAG: DUF4175 family protein, partial [Paracoccaceae bacterium]